MPSPFPHRVTLAAPVLALPEEARSLAEPIADVLAAVIHAQLVRHPVVSVLDPDEERVADDEGALLCSGHDGFANVLERAFLDDRRDEVIWFELAPEPGKALRAKLRVVTSEERTDEELDAIGDPTLSGLLATCLAQWLASRRLPPATGAWPLFGATDLFTAASQVARFRAEALRDPTTVAMPAGFGGSLEVAATRAAWKGLGRGEAHRASMRRVLALVPDEPHALRAEALYRIAEGTTPHVAMGPVVAIAPQWGPPRLAMHGAGLPDNEALRHAATAALLMPGDPRALHALALGLSRAGRFEEAVRAADRAAALDASFVQARVTALRALRDTHRSGESYLVARGRAQELVSHDGTTLDPRALAALSLVYAESAFDVGQLDEAIEIASDALDAVQDEASFRRQREELQAWRSDADLLAASFARDGFFRADPGRVLDGFARTRPRFSLDVAMIVRALVALGHEDVARFACAEHLGTGVALGPHARASRAFARMVAADVDGAMEDVTVIALRHPQAKLDAECHRVLRVGATHDRAPFERCVGEWLDRGARRIARLVARDAADFVVGLESSSTVLGALGPRAAMTFDAAWLEPLVETLDARSLVAIEAFFNQYRRPTLEHADRLAGDWHMLIAPSRREEQTWLEQVLYVLAQALGRYLVASTDAPSPLAGGYRQVALDALALVARFGRDWKTEWLLPLFGVIEQASTGVDPWLFDVWMLRVERAFGLEHETGGHLGAATRDAPRVRRALRGDERIAFEHGFALELLAEGHAEQAAEHLERTVRAVGSGVAALRWADAARGRGGDVTDVLWTAALAHPAHPLGWAHLARDHFSGGRAALAFEALLRAMPVGGDEWRERIRIDVRAAWESSALDVPIDPTEAETQGMARLARDDAQGGLRCLRWAHACAPRRVTAADGLATACARSGDAPGVLEALVGVDRTRAVELAAERLERAGAPAEAARARRYAAACSAAGHVDRTDDTAAPEITAARRALWTGDRDHALASSAGHTDWAMRRIALCAAEMRIDGDDTAPVRRAALVAAEDVLRASVGSTDLSATLARVHALRIRESYCFPVDPPPPLGEIVTREQFELMWRGRSEAPIDRDRATVPLDLEAPGGLAAATLGFASARPTALDVRATPASPATLPAPSSGEAMVELAMSATEWQPSRDRESRSSTDDARDEPCARASDLVAAIDALRGDAPLDALEALGLDLVGLGRALERWGARVAADPELRAHLTELLHRPRSEEEGGSR